VGGAQALGPVEKNGKNSDALHTGGGRMLLQ
jgi:hypothetical protein